MKKQLLWAALLLAAAFASCSKNELKSVNAPTTGKDNLKTNVAQPTYSYVDLVLQPRQPGEAFDTYRCVYGGANVKVTGSPLTWNSNLYPSLKNGVPAIGGTYSVDNGNMISSSSVGSGDSFILSLGTVSIPNITAMHSDLDKYQHAIDVWVAKNSVDPDFFPLNPYPSPYDYVKNTYTDPNSGFISITGKLIRVTTGSTWALATMDYPLPTAAPPTIPNSTFQITDPDHPTDTYFLNGIKGTISGGRLRGVNIQATGNYTYLGNATFHLQGRVYRSDSTFFDFDITQDPS